MRRWGTERVEARLLEDGRWWPPANESCMEEQGVNDNNWRDPDKKARSQQIFHRKWLGGDRSMAGVMGLVRAL